jgi:hypothetical protein
MFLGNTVTARFALAAAVSACVLTPIVEAASAGRCGGSGGRQERTVQCRPGEYIVGLGVRRGQYVDSISVECREISPAGAAGRRRDWITVGASGGTRFSSDRCAVFFEAISSVSFYSGAWVDYLQQISCSSRDSTDGSWSRSRSPGRIFPQAGLVGGIPCELRCPPGEALSRITVRYDGWIDSIEGSCRQ